MGAMQVNESRRRIILFVSSCSLVDSTSGAAIATLRGLQFLGTLGFSCRAFCASFLDAPTGTSIEQILSDQKIEYGVRPVQSGNYAGRALESEQGSVKVTVFRTAAQNRWQGPEEVQAFLHVFWWLLNEQPPDIVMAYGGDPVTQAMLEMSRRQNIPVVFCLHNFSYRDSRAFQHADYAITPSDFARSRYKQSLGLECQTIPNTLSWETIRVANPAPRFLTFVNPQRMKGLCVVARIISELARRRPDIPILIVEGRARCDAFREIGFDAGRFGNVFLIRNTPRPTEFYRLSKLVLMPSLCQESFGLVAAEAMSNGIPVLASDRGALPETVGSGGFFFNIPERYTPETRDIPTAEEIGPRVETILRLWDDHDFYNAASRRARAVAERWSPERLAPIYRDFFTKVSSRSLHPIELPQ
jgi:glycosyltransferase involved in cell wall biosynthesis